MTLQVEWDAKQIRELLSKPDVREAMKTRCDQEGHSWQNAMTPFLQVYRVCDWCSERR